MLLTHQARCPPWDSGVAQVWLAAASQIFYSTGVGWGTLVAFASYNEHGHNFMRDAWLVPLINCGTSFLAGLVVFSVLGFMAQTAGLEVADLELAGPTLAFVAYPQAISEFPGAPVFSVLFFLMVLCLGVDSQFAMVETVLTALNDAGVMASLSKPQKSAVVCLGMALIGLLFVTRAGMHWLELFDAFASNLTLFVIGLLECVAIGWVYGADRFAADAASMTGQSLPRWVLWMYKFLIPLLLSILSLTTLVLSLMAVYDFPPAGIAVGWLLTCTAAGPIVWFACKHYATPSRRVLAQLSDRMGGRSTAVIRAGPRVELAGQLVEAPAAAAGSTIVTPGGSPARPNSPAPIGTVVGAGGSPQTLRAVGVV